MFTVEPGNCGRNPCIREMRITGSDVLEYLAACMTVIRRKRIFELVSVMRQVAKKRVGGARVKLLFDHNLSQKSELMVRGDAYSPA